MSASKDSPSIITLPKHQPIPPTMHPELERLIDLALADGKITDKELEVLYRKAQELAVDMDEFEMVLEGKLHLAQKSTGTSIPLTANVTTTISTQKEGDLRKCPSCGSVVPAFATICSDCGHEFRNSQSCHSVQQLANMLNAVHAGISQANTKMDIFARSLGINPERDKMKSIIRNFPVPNTKEDLLEFLAMAIPNCKKPSFFLRNTSWENQERYEMADVWKAKCEQIVMKARFSMKNDPATLSEIEHYAKMLKI